MGIDDSVRDLLLAALVAARERTRFWGERLEGIEPPADLAAFAATVPVTKRRELFAAGVRSADRILDGAEHLAIASIPSSGTSGGRPVYSLVDWGSFAAAKARLDRLFAERFGVASTADGRPGTLLINGLGGGTQLPGGPTMAVRHAGPRTELVAAYIADLAPEYDQVILVAEPRFAKEAVEHIVAAGLHDGLTLHVAMGGDYLWEGLRDHLAGLLGVDLDAPEHPVIGASYGMGEVGLNLLFETDDTLRIRRRLRRDPALRTRVCGTALPTAPLFMTWEPDHVYVEAPDRTLVLTTLEADRFQPVIRYDTEDRGSVVGPAGLQALRDAGLQLPDGARLAWLYGRDAELPGRDGGAWPAAVGEALFHDAETASAVTGAFQLRHHREDDRRARNPRVHLTVEAHRRVDEEALAQAVRAVVLDGRKPVVEVVTPMEEPLGRRAPHEFKPRYIDDPLLLRRIHVGTDRFREVEVLRRVVFGEAPADDDHELLSVAEDEHAHHWVVETKNGEIVGSMRVILGAEGPFEDEQELLLPFWQGEEGGSVGFTRAQMAQVGRMVVTPDHRGRLASTMMMRHLYVELRDYGVKLVFLDCVAPLVPLYESHGYRRFRKPYTHPLNGHRYEAMVCFLEDAVYLRDIEANAAHWARSLLARFDDDDEARRWFEAKIGARYAGDLHSVVLRIAAPFRHYFSNEELRRRSAAFSRRALGPGEVVIREGDDDRAFYIVESGTLVATRRGVDGAPVDLGGMQRGDFFGELGALAKSRRSATVAAGDDGAELLVLTDDQLQRELMEMPSLCISMLRVLVDRFHQADGPPREDLDPIRFEPMLFGAQELGGLSRFSRKGPQRVEPGTRIVEKGTRGDTTFFVLEGDVVVLDGADRIVLGAGRSVGDWGALARLERSADVVVGDRGALLLPLSVPRLVAAIERIPGVGIKLVLHVARMLYRRRARAE